MQSQLAREFILFFRICVQLRSHLEHYNILYESGTDRHHLLEHTSRIFFSDMRALLIEHIVLHVCKITDPAGDGLAKKADIDAGASKYKSMNLTISHFMEECDFTGNDQLLQELEILSVRIHEFAKLLRPARNKIISHSDVDALMASKPLGVANRMRWNQFVQDLTDFTQLLGTFFGDNNRRIDQVAILSDADDLVKALKHNKALMSMVANSEHTKAVMHYLDSSAFKDA